MYALVTGGAGFIGSAIARALLSRGDTVRVFDSFLSGFEKSVPKDADLFRGDLRDNQALTEACRDVDLVFHQGAVRSVPRSVDEPFLVLECNILGTMNVLDAAERSGVKRVIYASSSSVYGDTGGAMNHESMATAPASPYAVSKLAGEHYCRVWTGLGRMPTVSLRYFNVFGPGQHAESKYAAVFPGFISALIADKPPEIHWDGEQSRDFTYIDDVVRANLLAGEASSMAEGSVINIGGGGGKTVNEVLHSVSEALNKWMEPTHSPKRAGDVRHTRADISKAAKLLGWKPEAEWQESVASTVKWFVEDGGLES